MGLASFLLGLGMTPAGSSNYEHQKKKLRSIPHIFLIKLSVVVQVSLECSEDVLKVSTIGSYKVNR